MIKNHMLDVADKSYLIGINAERIRLGWLEMKRQRARELLTVILVGDWKYVPAGKTDIRDTLQRAMGTDNATR